MYASSPSVYACWYAAERVAGEGLDTLFPLVLQPVMPAMRLTAASVAAKRLVRTTTTSREGAVLRVQMCTMRDGRQYEASDRPDLGELSKVLAV